MKKNKIKNAKGIMISDAIVAILMIILFTGTITSLIYNTISETTKTKIYSQEMDIATDIFEYIAKINYNDVNVENISEYINSAYNGKDISAGANTDSLTTTCKIGITITPYSELEGNSSKYDFIKVIQLNIKRKMLNKDYETKISTIKKANAKEAQKVIEGITSN